MNSWEQFCNGFIDFLNQDLVVILGTIFGSGALILSIIGKTSIGKKALNRLVGLITKSSDELKNAKLKLEETNKNFEEYKENKEKELKETKDYYSAKLYAFKEEYSKLETLCLGMAKNSNNVHVKELVNEYEKAKIDFDNLNVSEIVENAKKEVEDKCNDYPFDDE